MYKHFGRGMDIGTKVNAKDSFNWWCQGKIVNVGNDGNGDQLKIHFHNWNEKFDEWIYIGDGRLLPAEADTRDHESKSTKDKLIPISIKS